MRPCEVAVNVERCFGFTVRVGDGEPVTFDGDPVQRSVVAEVVDGFVEQGAPICWDVHAGRAVEYDTDVACGQALTPVRATVDGVPGQDRDRVGGGERESGVHQLGLFAVLRPHQRFEPAPIRVVGRVEWVQVDAGDRGHHGHGVQIWNRGGTAPLCSELNR